MPLVINSLIPVSFYNTGQDIIHNRSKIIVDISLRLARFFGVSDKYFLDMQNDIDIRNSKKGVNEINDIEEI